MDFFVSKSLRKKSVIYQNWLVTDGRPILEHIQHNHSYHLPPESAGALQRPVTRDKQKGTFSELAIFKWHGPTICTCAEVLLRANASSKLYDTIFYENVVVKTNLQSSGI